MRERERERKRKRDREWERKRKRGKREGGGERENWIGPLGRGCPIVRKFSLGGSRDLWVTTSM